MVICDPELFPSLQHPVDCIGTEIFEPLVPFDQFTTLVDDLELVVGISDYQILLQGLFHKSDGVQNGAVLFQGIQQVRF